MERILLIEDSVDFQLLVRKTLGSRFEVVCASQASEALSQIERGNYDLVLLDVVLPDADGFQLCTQMRSNEKMRDVPIIFLTGKTGVTDKVMGFSLGADDYIVKPPEPLELRARIEARLAKVKERRRGEEVICVGNLKVSVASQKTYRIEGAKEIEIDLTPIEFKILAYLARHEEHVLSRQQLLVAVWGQNVYVLDRTIDKHICSLRNKLGPLASYVQTVSGAGYRFSTTRTA